MMHRWFRIARICLILTATATLSRATTIHVATTGNDANDGLSWENAKLTVQAGVTAAVAGDHPLVLVSNGVYNANVEITVATSLTVAAFDPDATQTVLQRTRFLLQHEQAMIRGFTIENASRAAKIEAGTVSGCIIRNNENSLYGCGIWMTGGVVTNCVIRDNYLWGTHGSALGGAGVRMEGGLLVDSVIEGNEIVNWRVGAGVRAEGGVIERCIIRGNVGEGSGAGVYLTGGTILRNSLVTDNHSRQEAGGVYVHNGSVESCTIARNQGAGYSGGLYLTSNGSAVNTIVFDNHGASIGLRNLSNNGGTVSHTLARPLPAGLDNLDADPEFTDPDSGDYRLRAGSPAINAGVELAWMSGGTDLDSGDRIIGAAPDLGAYEAHAADAGPLRINFVADTRRITAPGNVAFTASVAGENQDGLHYYWDFGNGTVDGAGLDAVSRSYNPGIYTVSLTVSNSLDQGAGVVKDRYVVAGPLDLYVSPEGNAIPPYGDWDSALTDIHWAFEHAGNGDTIYLAGREYPLTRTLTFAGSQVTVKGGYQAAGGSGPGTRDGHRWPSRLVRDPAVEALRMMAIEDAAHSTFEDLWIEGGRGYRYKSLVAGGGLAVLDSDTLTFLRCRVVDNTAVLYGGGIYSKDSTVTFRGGEIAHNRLFGTWWSQTMRGGGVYLSGGEWTIQDTAIGANNTDRSRIGASGWDTREQLHGGGLYFDGGTHEVRNCAVYGNNSDQSQQHATVVHIRYGGGIYVNAGTVNVRNSTIAGNCSEGVRRAGGSLALTDSILWDNGDDVVGTVAVNYCNVATGGFAGSNNNISEDPMFVRGLYLHPDSSSRNAGSDTAAALGLDTYTTQTNGVPDSGTVDLGYHYADGLLPGYADLYVAETGDDTASGATPGAALRTVTRALALARDGTHIHVGAGIYHPASGEIFPLVMRRPGLHLIGAGMDDTILDANEEDQVITITGIPVGGRLADMTIRGGYTYYNYGGGIGIWRSEALLESLRVTGNRRHGPSIRTIGGWNYGGGIGGFQARVTLRNSLVVSNRNTCAAWDGAAPGGGIGIRKGEWTIQRTVIAFNEADGTTRSRNYGGGLLVDGGTHLFENLLVYSNRCNKVATQTIRLYDGDGVYVHNTALFQTQATFRNCTFAHNEGQGLYVHDIEGGVDPDYTTVNSSIAWGNSVDVVGAGSEVIAYAIGVTGPVAVAWSNIQEPHAGAGNLNEEPWFAGGGDYHLRSRQGRWTPDGWVKDAEHSPCISAGDPKLPLREEVWPHGNRINMGAYGGTAQASMEIIRGTLFMVR